MTKKTDAPDKTAPTIPRPRAAAHRAARTEFEQRAVGWLRGQPGRVMQMPQQLAAVTALGVPCGDCGDLVHRDRQDGHRVEWNPAAPGSWAAGITARCRG